ncbi:MAG: FprA family A-type flavoprotein [Clostridiales Family XIII bacterium]|jgi:flavorubredoxin|nr:FprA family A-type flavoprotein [Clostridiales Family XIII bacterium]
MLTKKLKEDFYWVGNLDPDLRIFDIVMYTDHGTSYNSYILKGRDKTVLFETAKDYLCEIYLKKLADVVPVSEIDIIVCDHTEPDHAGCVEKLIELNPNIEVYGSTGAINFLGQIVNKEFNSHAVADGETLDIGGKTLRFITAPNLHWPDTMFTYVEEDKILVSCDCFGSHYAYGGVVDDDGMDQEVFVKTMLYYFDNIMGPFKADVLAGIEKIKDLDIEMIANGHGPVLVNNPWRVVELYREWATPKPASPRKRVVIPYVTSYGYTRKMAESIKQGIEESEGIDVKLYDMSYADLGEVMDEICNADGFLLGTPTIAGEALVPIWEIAVRLNAKIHGGKPAGVFGSYGWSGEGVPNIAARLKQVKVNMTDDGLRIRFKPNEEEIEKCVCYGREFAKALPGD